MRRMFWVNYLGNVVLVNELLKRGLLAQGARIVVVCSGSYEYGSRKDFDWKGWNPLQSSQAYAQSKFLVTIWADWLAGQLRPKGIEVVAMCPGPMNSGLGCEHVPLPLWPSFALMR